MKALRIHSCQNGFSLSSLNLDRQGALLCQNLRHNAPEGSALVRVGSPRLEGTLEGRPLLADRRDDTTYFFRQDDDSSIILDSVCRDGKWLEKLNAFIGAPGAQVKDMTAAGQFLVLLLADGSLNYILYDAEREEYSWLGPLPQLPEVNYSATETQVFSASLDAVTFRSPQPASALNFDSEARSDLSKAVKNAWDALLQAAARAGCWVEPVLVRTALRLWDGSLLDVGSPQRLQASSASSGWQGNLSGRLAPVTDSSGNVTGVEGSSLQTTGYRIAVEGNADLGQWNDVVRYVEVWVTPESYVPDFSAQLSAHLDRTGSTPAVVVKVAPRALEVLERELSEAPFGRLSAAFPGRLSSPLSRSSAISYTSELLDFKPVEVNRSSDCSCILGHDGFLHIASQNRIVSCRRGNPFSLIDSSEGTHAEAPFSFMIPLVWGGGAYTRQIIYAAHARGVAALALDAQGRHCNFRTICRTPAISRDAACFSDKSVVLLLADGSLNSFDGTRYSPLITGLFGAKSLAWDARRAHIRVFGPGGQLALSPEKTSSGFEAHTRTDGETLRKVPGREDWLWEQASNGLVSLFNIQEETPAAADSLPAAWAAVSTQTPPAPLLAEVALPLWGDPVDAQVRLAAADPLTLRSPLASIRDASHTLYEASLSGTPRGALRLPIRMPQAAPGPGRLRNRSFALLIEVSGLFDGLEEPML